jgi:hypothetical protein
MSAFLRKSSASCLKILGLGCLVFLLAAPASAQDDSQKGQAPPPASSPPPAMKRKMAPPPAPAPQQEKAAEESFRGRQEKSLDMKKSTGKVGGQEIRSKKGQDEE